MSFFGNGAQNGGTGRSGGTPQTALLTGPPQFLVNSNQLNQIQFQGTQKNFTFPQTETSQNQLQLSTGGTPLILQPPVNFVTDQLGLNQLITQAAVSQSQQNLQSIMSLGLQMTEQQSQSGGQQSKQRVFTGMVTKIHDNFGFIDEEVFFQMGVVKGPILPKEGDRVLVEADFNPSMPFKWNATRVQIVNMGGGMSSSSSSSCSQQSSAYQQHQQQMMGYPTSMSSGQKSVPPPSISSRGGQNVSIVSNPHSIYSSTTSRPLSGTNVHVPLQDSLGQQRRAPSQLSSHLSQDVSLPSLLQKLDSVRERERERKDRDKDRERMRDRSRSKERIRDRERDRRDRSRERKRSRSRSKSRERRLRKSPSPRRRSPERARDRPRERDRSPEPRIRDGRDRSPLSVTSSSRQQKSDRLKRSRSRDTIKSSEGKNGTANEKGRSLSPRRNSKSTMKPTPRYSVEVPRFSFDALELNGKDLKLRYSNLYIPSDLFLVKASWVEAFPLDKPFTINQPSPVHIFGRRVERIEIPDADGRHEKFKQVPAILDAPDASCTFSVKVMLLSTTSMDNIFRKSGFLSDGKETGVEKEDISYQPLQRLMTFVVGVKNGKHDIMALGGAWSPSLDGPDPQSNPKVLINTAIRCVKSMTSIDLTRCKSWYRFMELYYRRSNGNLETVVYFLPDLTSVVPSRDDWEDITKTYRMALYGKDFIEAEKLKKEQADAAALASKGSLKSKPDNSKDKCQIKDSTNTTVADTPKDDADVAGEDEKLLQTEDDDIIRMEVIDECNGDADDNEDVGMLLTTESAINEEAETNKLDSSFDIYDNIVEVSSPSTEKNMEIDSAINPPVENLEETEHKGTHFTLLDPKNMNVAKLREELSLRNLNSKGLKAQLTSRLIEALENEQNKTTNVSRSDVNEKEKAEEPSNHDASTSVEVLRIVDTNTITESESDVIPSSELKGSTEDGEIKNDDEVTLNSEIYPIIKSEMSPEEKKQWERRYALPKNPRILIFPVSSIKSGAFDCSIMPLSSLRDYRQQDRREESFEVSLFSEFFYEMLQRDFGFKIYTEIVRQAKEKKASTSDGKDKESIKKEDTEKSTKDKDNKEPEPSAKRRKVSSASVVTVESGNSKEGKEKEKTKIVNPMLLLAFTFFDEHRCGHILDTHIEDICSSLGLGITRHELQKVLRKVVSKGNVHYRKWTDKAESEIMSSEADSKADQELIRKISRAGNKTLLPVFTYSTPVVTIDGEQLIDGDGLNDKAEHEESLLVNIDGKMFDVRKMKTQIEIAEKERTTAEATVNVLKNSLNEAKNQLSELKKSNENLNDDLRKTKESLKKVESSDKTNKEDLDTFRKSTERYLERIKDLVKLPVPTLKEKEKDKEKDTLKKKDSTCATDTEKQRKDDDSKDKK